MANEWTEIAQAVCAIATVVVSIGGLWLIIAQIRQANRSLKQSC